MNVSRVRGAMLRIQLGLILSQTLLGARSYAGGLDFVIKRVLASMMLNFEYAIDVNSVAIRNFRMSPRENHNAATGFVVQREGRVVVSRARSCFLQLRHHSFQ